MVTWIRKTGHVLTWFALVVLAFLLLALVIVPKMMGGSTYTVLSGSMEPQIKIGDVVVVRPVEAKALRIGDVITYQLESGREAVVTHRIVRVEARSDGTRSFITQGDANNVLDKEPVRPVQLRGKVAYAVPKVGWVTSRITNDVKTVLTRTAAGLVIMYGAVLLLKPTRRRKVRAASKSKHALRDQAGSPEGRESPQDSHLLEVVDHSAGIPKSLLFARSSRGGHVSVSALIVVGLVASTVLGSAPAEAAEASGYLVYSKDGETWTSASAANVFPPELKLVPGDDYSADLWIKNPSDQTIMLELGLVVAPKEATAGDEALADELQVHVNEQVGAVTYEFEPGAIEQVKLGVLFPASVTSLVSRKSRVNLALNARYEAPQEPTPTPTYYSPDGEGPTATSEPTAGDPRGSATPGLSDTGMSAWILLVAAALVSGGAVTRRRHTGWKERYSNSN